MNKIKDNLGKIFLLLLAVGLFFFGYTCGSKTVIPLKVTETHSRDTIFPPDTIINLPTKDVPYPVYIHDTAWIPKPVDSLDITRFHMYKDSTEDSNIKIYSKVVTQGKTLSQPVYLSYKLKVPLMIFDSTVITRTKDTVVPYKYEIQAGILASPIMLAPMLELSINKHTFGAGYDPFNKQPIISYKYRLIGWTPKKKK